MLHFKLKVNNRTISTFSAVRQDNKDLANLPLPEVRDVVSTYAIEIDGKFVGNVQHRYGDGALELVSASLSLYRARLRGE